MADNTINVKIKQRTDTEANWSSNNPVLLKGEMAISSDKNGMYKVGDGTSTWSALSYNKADTANSATTASTATKATQDSAGQQINTTYIKGLSASGKTVTYTRGDGSTGSITTQDTHYESKNVVGSSIATSNTTSALTNGNVYLNSVENGSVTSSHKISGSDATTVTSDANGNIVVKSSNTTNTAGATNTSSKIYLVGATSQAASPQTYSHDTAYVGTDGCLYSGGKKVTTEGHTHPEYSPLEGSTSLTQVAETVRLGEGNSGSITQDNGTYRQVFEITDDSQPMNAAFRFLQSSDDGATYASLCTIRGNGTVVAVTFSGNSDTQDAEVEEIIPDSDIPS